jgi:uncharacterized caspase-like protein
MQSSLKSFLALLAFFAALAAPAASAAPSQKRLALVVGNGSYTNKALMTSVNDAALIAQTLQTAGFDVTGARDLDQGLMHRMFRDFADKVAHAGPDAVALVYFAGYGMQFEGENYLIPVGTDSTEAANVSARALALSEVMQSLAVQKATFIILDAARASPFQSEAGGLAWVEPEANMLIAYNAAPGTVAPTLAGSYGPYAKALAEMIREGNLTPANLFDRVRLRVHELTRGAQVPWDASKIDVPFKFFERAAGAPVRADVPERTEGTRVQPMRVLGVQDGYMVAVLRDTFDGYSDFLADYWQGALTKRVRALLAPRREAITWRRTFQANGPDAYWSYLERYPHGPHVADAGRLLKRLGASTELPAKFARMDYDIPPPLPDELEYIERSSLALDDPAFALEQPQPCAPYFLEPPPAEFADLKPPVASSGAHNLPALALVPLPVYVRLPPEVEAPNAPMINVSESSARTTVATKSDRQIASLPISPPRGDEVAPNVARLAPNAAAKNAMIDSSISPAVGQVGTEESKPLPAPPSAKAARPPQWFVDITTPANRDVARPSPFTIEGEGTIAAPTMFALPSSGLVLRTWIQSVPLVPTAVRAPVTIPRSVAHAPLRTGLLPETPPALTTGSILSSVPRSVRIVPPTRTPAKPAASAASSQSPIRTDRPNQPKTPPIKKPAPSINGAQTPKDLPEAPK